LNNFCKIYYEFLELFRCYFWRYVLYQSFGSMAKSNSNCTCIKARERSLYWNLGIALSSMLSRLRDHVQSYPTRYVDSKPVIGLSTGVSFRWLYMILPDTSRIDLFSSAYSSNSILNRSATICVKYKFDYILIKKRYMSH